MNVSRKGEEVYIDSIGYPMGTTFEMRGFIVGETEDNFAVEVPVFRGNSYMTHIIPKIYCISLDNDPDGWVH